MALEPVFQLVCFKTSLYISVFLSLNNLLKDNVKPFKTNKYRHQNAQHHWQHWQKLCLCNGKQKMFRTIFHLLESLNAS